jgi:C1A family cysteine protease
MREADYETSYVESSYACMILLLTGCGEAAGTGKTQGTAAEQSQAQTVEQSQLQTAEQSQAQTEEQSQLQTAVLLTEKDYSDQEKKSLEILEGKLAKDSDRLVYSGNFIVNIYDDFSWKTEADIFPAKLDLRARGTATPVKSQSPWASCWSFGAIASSETSILKKLV